MQTDITYIRAAASTMQRLLNELLNVTCIGRVVNPLTEVSPSELAQEAVTLVSSITARGVQVHIAPDLPVVVGDRPRLLEVLQNLLDNAVKFMGAQPQPRINFVRRDAEETVCYVRDNGIGTAPRYHEKVFSPRAPGWLQRRHRHRPDPGQADYRGAWRAYLGRICRGGARQHLLFHLTMPLPRRAREAYLFELDLLPGKA